MATKRAEVVSFNNLSKAVDKAVKIAGKRHAAALEADTLLLNWQIVGRRVRDFDGNPLQLATDISKGVTIPGLKPQPIVTKLGKDILVGFIDRGLPTPRVLG